MTQPHIDAVKQIEKRFVYLLDQRFTQKKKNSLRGIDSCICENDADIQNIKELNGKTIIVTDIGGSFVKLQVYKIENGEIITLGKLDKCFHDHEKKLSVQALASSITSHISDLLQLLNLKQVDRYAETFSFPAEINSKSIGAQKQVYSRAQDDLGKGWMIKGMSRVHWTSYIVDRLYRERLVREKSTISINDTVAVLLALLSKEQKTNKKNILAGVVMGTGFNMAMFDNEGILRNIEAAWAEIDLPHEHSLVLEKYYSGIDRTKHAEVQVGGGFGVPYVMVCAELRKELRNIWQYIGNKIGSELLSWTITDMDKVKKLFGEYNIDLQNDELIQLRNASMSFFDRATQVVAGMLLGIAKHKHYAPKSRLVFGLNGSVGLRAPHVKEKILRYIEESDYVADVVDLPDSTLDGPVIAGLCI